MMDSDDVRRSLPARIAPFAAAGLLLALLGAFLAAPPGGREPARHAPQAKAGAGLEEGSAASEPRRAALTRSAAAAAAGEAADACGFAPIDEADPIAVQSRDRRLAELSDVAIARLGQSLAAGPAALDRALSMILRDPGAADAAATAEIVRLAGASGDPRLHAVAAMRCDQARAHDAVPTGGACDLIDAQGWARHDPGNAWPWLVIADEAQEAGDDALASEALFHASRAIRSVPPQTLILGLVDHPAFRGLDPPQRLAATLRLQGMAAAVIQPRLIAPTNWCPVEIADANRRQSCSELAEMFVTRGGSPADLLLGLSLGRRAGWPPERLAELADRHEAYEWLLTASLPEPSLDCRWLEAAIDVTSATGQAGEIALANRLLVRSGRTVADIARQARAEAGAAGASLDASLAAEARPR